MAGIIDSVWIRTGAKLVLAAVIILGGFAILDTPTSTAMIASAQSRHTVRPVGKSGAKPPANKQHEEGFAVKRVLTIAGPFRHGDYAWDDKGVPDGPVIVTVDLAAQTLSVFRDGYEIGATVILYGANDKPTPLGVFPILEKDADHMSSLYDAPMPYMLRLTHDGVAIHGSTVALGAATHGCIGVPTKFAALLFAQVKRGDRVIITNGKMLDTGGLAPAV